MKDKFLMFEEIYMNFKMVHENYNVFDLKKSLDFYEKALGLKEVRRKEAVAQLYISSATAFFILYTIFLKYGPYLLFNHSAFNYKVFRIDTISVNTL